MAKTESVNTFSEGLNMDLNPLTTPKNLLTDSVNGTFITYNDNEFILQNDQGNHRLKDVVLSENFMPIGMKEYGDIIYIASYNPITKETEIGSYPSPLNVLETKSGENSDNISIIIDYTTGGDFSYNSLIEEKSKLYIYSSLEDEDLFFLNPGDQFFLTIPGYNKNGFVYQNIDFFSLGENKELYPISIPDSKINYIEGVEPMPDEYYNVFWEIPGWLAAKCRLANFSSYVLGVSSVNLSEDIIPNSESTFDASINFNVSALTNDDIFHEHIDRLKNDLKFYIKISVLDKSGTVIRSEELIEDCQSHDYSTINHNLYKSIFYENGILQNLSKDYSLKIESYPFLNYLSGEVSTIVRYDQFKQSVKIPLDSVYTSNNVKIAEEVFKYTVNADNVSLQFDAEMPVLNSSSVIINYRIYDLDLGNNSPILIGNINNNEFNFIGQNILSIDFTDKFVPENIYIFEFEIRNKNDLIKSVHKVFIPTTTLNSSYGSYNDFSEDVTPDKWLLNIGDKVKFRNVTIEETGKEESIKESQSHIEDLSIQDLNYDFPDNYDFRYVVENKIGLLIKYQTESVSGNLWTGLDIKKTLNFVANGEHESVELTGDPVKNGDFYELNAEYIDSNLYCEKLFRLNTGKIESEKIPKTVLKPKWQYQEPSSALKSSDNDEEAPNEDGSGGSSGGSDEKQYYVEGVPNTLYYYYLDWDYASRNDVVTQSSIIENPIKSDGSSWENIYAQADYSELKYSLDDLSITSDGVKQYVKTNYGDLGPENLIPRAEFIQLAKWMTNKKSSVVVACMLGKTYNSDSDTSNRPKLICSDNYWSDYYPAVPIQYVNDCRFAIAMNSTITLGYGLTAKTPLLIPLSKDTDSEQAKEFGTTWKDSVDALFQFFNHVWIIKDIELEERVKLIIDKNDVVNYKEYVRFGDSEISTTWNDLRFVFSDLDLNLYTKSDSDILVKRIVDKVALLGADHISTTLVQLESDLIQNNEEKYKTNDLSELSYTFSFEPGSDLWNWNNKIDLLVDDLVVKYDEEYENYLNDNTISEGLWHDLDYNNFINRSTDVYNDLMSVLLLDQDDVMRIDVPAEWVDSWITSNYSDVGDAVITLRDDAFQNGVKGYALATMTKNLSPYKKVFFPKFNQTIKNLEDSGDWKFHPKLN